MRLTTWRDDDLAHQAPDQGWDTVWGHNGETKGDYEALVWSPKAIALRQVRKMYDKSGLANMKHNPETGMKVGIVTIFDMAVVYDNPVDALKFYLNRRGRKNKFGEFRGWIIGECPTGDVRLTFEYYKPDPKVEARIAKRRAFAKRREPVWYLRKWHTKGTMTHFIGKPKRKTKKLVRLKRKPQYKETFLAGEEASNSTYQDTSNDTHSSRT